MSESAVIFVIILMCESRKGDQNKSKLLKIFSDPYFVVQTLEVGKSEENSSPILLIKDHRENLRMRKALEFSQKEHKNLPCLIIKDSSVTLLETSKIKELIKESFVKANTADLIFLCKWKDNCERYLDIEGTNMKWTQQPTATQAIIYKPNARDLILSAFEDMKVPLGSYLNNTVKERKLKAVIYTPNVFNFDINLANTNSDYEKLAECATEVASSDKSSYTWIWFPVLAIFFAIIIFLVLLK